MNKIDAMNRRTREANARNVDRFNTSTQSNYNSVDWRQNYYNQQTYYSNNSQYSKKYF